MLCCNGARKEGTNALVTSPEFEQWLLWHADDGRNYLNSVELDRLMKKMKLMEGKNLSSAFPAESYGRAVENSRRADLDMDFCLKGPCPSSSMPLIIELMTGTRA